MKSSLSSEAMITLENPEVTFYFCSHETQSDAEKFRPLLEQADVYIPEVRGWNENAIQRYNNVSAGQETPEQANQICADDGTGRRSEFTLQLWRMLSGTSKKIVIVDIPAGYDEGHNNSPEKDAFSSNNFDEVVAKQKLHIEQEASAQIKREDYIFHGLKALLTDGKIGELMPTGDNLKVLITIGAIHTQLYHRAVKDRALKNVSISSVFSSRPMQYTYWSEAIRKSMFGKEVDNMLVARTLIEDKFFPHVENTCKLLSHDDVNYADSETQIRLTRALIDGYSIGEIKEILGVWGSDAIGGNIFSRLLRMEGFIS